MEKKIGPSGALPRPTGVYGVAPAEDRAKNRASRESISGQRAEAGKYLELNIRRNGRILQTLLTARRETGDERQVLNWAYELVKAGKSKLNADRGDVGFAPSEAIGFNYESLRHEMNSIVYSPGNAAFSDGFLRFERSANTARNSGDFVAYEIALDELLEFVGKKIDACDKSNESNGLDGLIDSSGLKDLPPDGSEDFDGTSEDAQSTESTVINEAGPDFNISSPFFESPGRMKERKENRKRSERSIRFILHSGKPDASVDELAGGGKKGVRVIYLKGRLNLG